MSELSVFEDMIKQACDVQREAGANLLEYFRELLERDDDDAKVELHCDHMRDLLTFASVKR